MELPYKSYYIVELTNMGLETAPFSYATIGAG